ncbi:EAL domain-containing protein [Vibrio sp. 431]|uniref:EAL domain-containing protein n=1 Tax=Vibrio sp. 431 TaxID=3074606 RepID=UPI0029643FB9|nr:EAL domain-containing protein [Vibrio sp. 431]MDW1972650.1 EAL domain-containing protein [Vibrio sp. 945]MDW2008651.1 EAL domain-containing protein [Vibrio sp. 431]
MNELFEFSAEEDTAGTSQKNWVMLSVEDNQPYQDVLESALQEVAFEGRKIDLLRASSAASAATILSKRQDISLILLDIVMETDDAGFYLIDTIRNVIGDELVRIVVLTGQPGVKPHDKAINEYNISEYWNKTDLSADKLKSVVVSNLRTWQISQELQIARRGLQMIVDASRSLTARQDTSGFAHTVLEEIARVINVPNTGGIVCVVKTGIESLLLAPIVAASSHFRELIGARLENVFSVYDEDRKQRVEKAIFEAWQTQQHIFENDFTLLFFDTSEHDEKQYLMLVDSPHALDSNHLNLLQAFAENISSGFVNQALMNKLSQLAYLDTPTGIHNFNWLARELGQQSTYHINNSSLVLFRLLNYDTAEIMAGHDYATKMFKAFCLFINEQLPKHYLLAVWDRETVALVFTLDNKPGEDKLKAIRNTTMEMDELDIQLQFQVGTMDFKDTQSLSLAEVLVLANTALGKARSSGVDVYNFDYALIQRLANRMRILTALKKALTTRESFFLVLQPKVNLATGKPVGFEALLRWRVEDNTLCPPSEFIPIAEASGLSLEISEMVVAKTIEVIQRLQAEGYSLPVSFNLANSDVVSPIIFNEIHRCIDEQEIDASLLDIEVTETQATEDYTVINPLLRSFIDKGVGVSIDDFGTGYSSLSQLADLAATTIKLDQKFVNDLTAENKDKALHIVQMIARLAELFAFKLIAEGVETEEQRQLLMDNGYQHAQGYYFAKPMPMDELLDWLAKT